MLADTPGFITWPNDGWLWNCGYVAHVSIRANLQVVLEALPEVLAKHGIVITSNDIETETRGSIVVVKVTYEPIKVEQLRGERSKRQSPSRQRQLQNDEQRTLRLVPQLA